MAHFEIKIKVVYDDATIPKNMARQLELAIDRAVQRGMLCDGDQESVVDEYSVEVVEK